MPFLYAKLIENPIGSRPAAGDKGRVFFSTDEKKTYYDDGSAWVDVSDGGAVRSVAGHTGTVTLAESDITGLVSDLAAKAPLASPTFTGTPAAPTPSTADNSTKLATTAYVQAQGYGTSSGTVSSVSLSLPSWLSVSGSPVTTSGTLTVTAATGQTANRFLATPNGSTGAVALRAIAPADLGTGTASSSTFLRGDGTWATPAGGFASPLTTKGDVHVYSTTDARLAVGADGQVLAADSTQTTGLKWTTPNVIAQNSKSAAYTTVLADAGGHLYHPGADTTARTWTIDSNANVAYPVGTAITFVNDTSAGTITIAITSDTMILAGTGATGSRTLAANGVATALKVTSTRWIISGTGLS